jgi:hypothetical protein
MNNASRHAVLAVRVPDLARFWGKRYWPEAEATERLQDLGGRHTGKTYSGPAELEDV